MKWQKNEKVRNAKKKVMIVGELKNSWLFIKGTRAFIVKKIKEVMSAQGAWDFLFGR